MPQFLFSDFRIQHIGIKIHDKISLDSVELILLTCSKIVKKENEGLSVGQQGVPFPFALLPGTPCCIRPF